ncbi:hypothetical protein JVT61DRAFT_10169 [Boletus reticuloceps]|uniref:DUF7582 domain-containing protein n=1 Tax=Boletus reticuloceps TaxID=495285 RepID=A0A8I2YWS8_9AGAM|nr:hypothetical protein JVT61DRAFT_10169 [Boletus reticuloceps]
MGIRSSRPADDFAELVNKGRPRPRQPEETYSKAKIEGGLKVVAKHLASKGLNVSIVAVGGAVNTVLLKSHASTGDVDFFYSTKDSGAKDSNIVHEVMKAGKLAEKELKLGHQWLNNHTTIFIEETTINDLYEQAIKQNEKVFSAKGLTVYAAPWNYALMTKLDRAAKHMADAVDCKKVGAGGLGKEIQVLIDKLAREYKEGIISGYVSYFVTSRVHHHHRSEPN